VCKFLMLGAGGPGTDSKKRPDHWFERAKGALFPACEAKGYGAPGSEVLALLIVPNRQPSSIEAGHSAEPGRSGRLNGSEHRFSALVFFSAAGERVLFSRLLSISSSFSCKVGH